MRLTVLASLLLAAGAAAAQDSAPTPANLAALLREQQQQLEAQRAQLARQQEQLERQQRQLESLAAALEAQKSGPTPAAGAAPAPGAPAASPGATATADATASGASPVPPISTASAASSAARGLRFEGYADFNYQRYDFYENAQSAVSTSRGQTDLARFVLAPSYDFGRGWSFAAEIEFEHGGTGAAVDYEREEAGEFEIEVEKGGEVALEQLWLQYEYSPALAVRLGELIVPVGMFNLYHQPSEYFGLQRGLSESSLLPMVWHESGIEMRGTLGQARYQLMFATALDSSGFSGYGFVSGGMQQRLELKNASAFALIGHLEYGFAPGILVGASYYFGDSAPNRPRQNLDVSADVNLAALYGRYEVGPLTIRGQALFGRIQNAEAITKANLSTFNGDVLGVSRTPVGSSARSYYIAAGYDLLSLFKASDAGRLDLFAQYENYDTNASTEGSIVRLERYARRATTLGLNYKPQPGIVLKAEFARLTNGGTVANAQNQFGLGAGFEF
jgi:hypothetical protein